MHMHHGLCMVGGNTSEIEGNAKIGGCYNGGPNIGSSSIPKYAPVPGGDRNCVRCRWFVTDPCHLPALNAHFNNIAYHLDEARNKALAYEETLQELKKKRAQAEDAKQPFLESATYRETERLYEGAMKNWSNLAEDSAACIRLIKRCETALKTSQGNGTQLVAVGTVMDVQIVFEGTDSELLQLSGICEDAEVYPDLDPGKAVLRRSQLLDNAFYRDGLRPFLLTLCEEDQLLVGNAVMRRLAHQADLANPILGKKKVISLIDAGQKLSEHLGTDLTSLLESVKQVEPILAKSLRLERK